MIFGIVPRSIRVITGKSWQAPVPDQPKISTFEAK
jgi:hypothetical protein